MTREEILESASRESTWEYLDSQPTHVSMPAELPSSIQDPLLMAGWVYLYNQENTFPLWDGSLLSGRTLAVYILENEVPILWGSVDICDGRSYSPRPTCTPESCTEQQPPVDSIYIASTLKNISESELTICLFHFFHFGRKLRTVLDVAEWARGHLKTCHSTSPAASRLLVAYPAFYGIISNTLI